MTVKPTNAGVTLDLLRVTVELAGGAPLAPRRYKRAVHWNDKRGYYQTEISTPDGVTWQMKPFRRAWIAYLASLWMTTFRKSALEFMAYDGSPIAVRFGTMKASRR